MDVRRFDQRSFHDSIKCSQATFAFRSSTRIVRERSRFWGGVKRVLRVENMFCLPLWMFPFLSPSNQYKYFRKNSPIRLDPIYLIYKSAFEAPSRIRTTFRSDGTEKRLQKSRQKIQENNRHSPSSSENRDDLARSRKITGQSEND